MRRIVIISSILLAAMILLLESGVIDSLVLFLLSGAVPGTSIIISPTAMMAGLVAVTWLVLTRITALGALNLMTMNRLVKHYLKKQQRMPKRRYSRI